jgi:hypothetical protein
MDNDFQTTSLLPPEKIYACAALSGTCPHTVRKALRGGVLRPGSRARIIRALEEMGHVDLASQLRERAAEAK